MAVGNEELLENEWASVDFTIAQMDTRNTDLNPSINSSLNLSIDQLIDESIHYSSINSSPIHCLI